YASIETLSLLSHQVKGTTDIALRCHMCSYILLVSNFVDPAEIETRFSFAYEMFVETTSKNLDLILEIIFKNFDFSQADHNKIEIRTIIRICHCVKKFSCQSFEKSLAIFKKLLVKIKDNTTFSLLFTGISMIIDNIHPKTEVNSKEEILTFVDDVILPQLLWKKGRTYSSLRLSASIAFFKLMQLTRIQYKSGISTTAFL
ncbi:MAG: hypothetical protein MHPSP_002409, partial [Paramarteilia canceri]